MASDSKKSSSGGDRASRSGSKKSSKRAEDIYPEFAWTRPKNRDGTNRDKVGEIGTTSTAVTLRANCAVLSFEGDCIYQYHIDFVPPKDSQRLRQVLLQQHTDEIGEAHLFNGQILYLPRPLTQFEFVSEHEGQTVTLKVRETGRLRPDDMQTITVLNVLNRRSMELNQFLPFGRHHYDPQRSQEVPAINMEVWPGLVSSVRPYEEHLLMQIDTSHKMLRRDTAYDVMLKLYNDLKRLGQEDQLTGKAEALLNGQTIVTKYNNKTYRVDDIDWEKTPLSEFEKKDGSKTTFKDYYLSNYQRHIVNEDQPLLVSRAKKLGAGRRDCEMDTTELIYLVPELCSMTGLTEQMRADRKVMQEVAKYTRVPPDRRVYDARERLQRIQEPGSHSAKLFDSWGVHVEPDLVQIRGRQFNGEQLIGSNDGKYGFDPVKADWSREMKRHRQYESVALRQGEWLIVVPQQLLGKAEAFFKSMQRNAPGLGMPVGEPIVIRIETGDASNFVKAIDETLANAKQRGRQLQMVFCVLPDDGKARYVTVKKHCSQIAGVASQMVLRSTLNRENIMDSISLKVMVQMNCKLGGAPWRINSKFKKPVMVVGYDCYNDSSERGKPVTTCVCTLNATLSKFQSQYTTEPTEVQVPKDTNIYAFLKNGLAKFYEMNGCLPSKVFVYRDGVGEGQVSTVFSYELKGAKLILQEAADHYKTEKPQLTFCIVNKRVNHRFFLETSPGRYDNPKPGTVVDTIVTRKERYDFYMVPQAVNQGTVTPVSYNIIWDETTLKPEQQQLFAFQLCHLYYNWQGTIRVPAVCMYAYKLAFMISQYIHGRVHPNLDDKLFFL